MGFLQTGASLCQRPSALHHSLAKALPPLAGRARRGVAPRTTSVPAGRGPGTPFSAHAASAGESPGRLRGGPVRLGGTATVPPLSARAGPDPASASNEHVPHTHPPPPHAPSRCRASPMRSCDCFAGLGLSAGTAGGGEQPGASSLMLLQNGLEEYGTHLNTGSFPASPATPHHFWPPCKTEGNPNLFPKAKMDEVRPWPVRDGWEDSGSWRHCLRVDGARALLWDISAFHNADESQNVVRA